MAKEVWKNSQMFGCRFKSMMDKYIEMNPKKSVDELANEIGVGKPTLYKWCKGDNISSSNLEKISRVFNCSVDYLLGLTDGNSLDANIQSTTDITKLSTKSVEKLINIASEFDDDYLRDEFRRMRMDIVNGIIESDKFGKLLDKIYDAQIINFQVELEKEYKAEPQYKLGEGVMLSGYDARSFFIQESQKIFGNILDEICIAKFGHEISEE